VARKRIFGGYILLPKKRLCQLEMHGGLGIIYLQSNISSEPSGDGIGTSLWTWSLHRLLSFSIIVAVLWSDATIFETLFHP